MQSKLRRDTQSGFSLMELIVVIAVIALLAGAMTPFFSGVSQSGKVATFLKLYDSLKSACQKHKIDAGTFAWEYNGYAASNRLLSGTQTYAGWKGPYIESPFTNGNNPFNQTCGLHVYATANPNSWIPAGWDLDADGTADVASGTACNVLYMPCVSQAEAKEVDDAIDKGMGGTSGWATAGRVVYLSSSSIMLVLIAR